MAENAPEEESDDEKMIDGSGMSDPNGESGEGEEGETGEGNGPAGDDGKEETGEGNPSAGDDKGEENGNGVPAGGAGDDGNDDVDGDAKAEEGKSSEVGGVESTGRGGPPTAETDTDANNAGEMLVDKNAKERTYGRIPALNEDLIIPYGEILEKSRPSYAEGGIWVDAKKAEIAALKDESKKTVGYMVKEFEMKKAADQYARAAVSKTGSLDMGRLHTYKYNEDIFKKVTTLPGATNHGMVMVVDWSGSMTDNLKGTLSQLFNLIWFCRRTQIPFEVFAFSDNRELFHDAESAAPANRYEMKMDDFKAGDLALHSFKLLEFFSSKMSAKEEIEMMEILWMVASYWSFETNREIAYDKVVLPYFLNLGGTPLNDAIVAMMEIVPKFKAETGVQKVNTIFLTDGASNRMNGVYDYWLDKNTGEHNKRVNTLRGSIMISDPKTLKSYEVNGYDITDGLLRVLKDRVPDMNLVGFFIAGSGRSGRVDKRALYSLQRDLSMDAIMEQVKFINKNKFLAIDSKGYDEMYVLPAKGMTVENDGLSDDLVGASKAKLKSAFGKSMKGKVDSRQLLNKFVKLVA
jgi:hypothetical protein